MNCDNCQSAIPAPKIFQWVYTCGGDFKCSGCHRKLGDFTNLSLIYLVAIIIGFLVVSNEDGFREDLPILGIDSVFALIAIILLVILPAWICLTAYISVYINNLKSR